MSFKSVFDATKMKVKLWATYSSQVSSLNTKKKHPKLYHKHTYRYTPTQTSSIISNYHYNNTSLPFLLILHPISSKTLLWVCGMIYCPECVCVCDDLYVCAGDIYVMNWLPLRRGVVQREWVTYERQLIQFSKMQTCLKGAKQGKGLREVEVVILTLV